MLRHTRILIASGDRAMGRKLGSIVVELPAEVSVAETGALAENLAGSVQPTIVILDLPLPDRKMVHLLTRLKEHAPGARIIVLANRASVSEAVDAMRAGAFTFLEQPVGRGALLATLTKASSQPDRRGVESRQPYQHAAPPTAAIAGLARSLRTLFETLQSVAPSDANCLIVGENGTGKELVANAIHAASTRAGGPFIKINCAALPEHLLESELFGHVKGAFTSAIADRQGLFALATGGSLFLDEIAEMVPHLQAKLLRVLQEREFRPLGSLRAVPLDARLICATNAHIGKAVNDRRLREDLLFRINTVILDVPPLRERMEDLPLLCSHFLDKFGRQYERTLRGFSPAAMLALARYRWPGNIRELEHVIERAVLLTSTDTIDATVLPHQVRTSDDTQLATRPALMTLAQIERRALLEALERANWNRRKAAAALGLNPATLHGKMRRYAIPDPYRGVRGGPLEAETP